MDPRDPALRRVVFIGFPKSLLEPERAEAMVLCMQKHLVDSHSTDFLFPDKTSMPTVNGNIRVNGKNVAHQITSKREGRWLQS